MRPLPGFVTRMPVVPGPAAALIAALVTGLVLAGPAAATAQEIPEPAEVEAGGDPGAEAPETVGVHTVRRGDTLWELAARFLSDPLRWPGIFELNTTVVEDPHWIYPGERLRIPGAVARVDGARVEMTEDVLRNLDDGSGRFPAGSIFLQPRDGGLDPSRLALDEAPPQPTVSASDHRSAPLLLSPGELGPRGETIRVMQENPLGLSLPSTVRQFDEVVLGLGGLDPSVGDTLKVVRRVRDEGTYGEVVVSLALLKVHRLWADSARARVVRLFGDYKVGDPVVALESYDLDPAARPEPVNGGLTGRVIAFEVPQVLLGLGEQVFLDVGADERVGLGDEFAVFSREEQDAIELAARDALVVLRVVQVAERTSTARVVGVRDPGTQPGDPVRLIRRMPGHAASDAD